MKISIQNNLKCVNDLNYVHKYSYFFHKQCTFLFSLTKITLNYSKNNMQYKHLNSGFENCTSHFTLLLYSQSYRDQATCSRIAIGHFTSCTTIQGTRSVKHDQRKTTAFV